MEGLSYLILHMMGGPSGGGGQGGGQGGGGQGGGLRGVIFMTISSVRGSNS